MSAKKQIPINGQDHFKNMSKHAAKEAQARINKLKRQLAKRNLQILKSDLKENHVYSISEAKAKTLLRKLGELSAPHGNDEVSADFSRGLVFDGNRPIFWSIDYLDERTLKAKLESEYFVVRFIPLIRFNID